MNIKKVLMLAAVGMSSLSAPMSAFADTQVANTADKAIVKKISYTSIDNKTARKGEDVKIRVDFSEDFRNQIKPGDKLVFDLPSELHAVETTIPLQKDGKGIFGNVVITNGQAVLEFNELVKSYDHIEGFFEIGTRVVADVPENGKIDVPMNLGTTLQVQMLELLNPTVGYNPNPLAYKGGTQRLKSPEIIDWDMPINSTNSKILSDMTITDTVGKGHKLNVDSLTLNGKSYKQAVADGDMTVDYINESGFKLVVKKEKVTGSIKYTTTIDANARKQKMMPNHFKIEAIAEGYLEQVWQGDRPVKNILALDGGIDGDQKEEHATEGVQEMPEEHTDDITVPEEHIDGSTVIDETNKAEETKPLPEQEVQLIEETVPEEQVEVLEGAKEEHLNVDGTPDETHVAEETKPVEENVEEVIEEIAPEEKLDVIEENVEHHADVNQLLDETHKAEQSTPLVLNFGEEVEEIVPVEEVDVLDVITPKPTPAPKPNEKPDAKKIVEPKPKVEDKKSIKKAVKTTNTKTENNSVKKSEALPNTGSVNNIALTLIGLLGLVAAVFVMIRRNK